MFEIITLPFGIFQACCYLIKLDSATCLIDPAISPKRLPAGIPPVSWIMATHGHMDHISEADSLRRETEALLWIHPNDAACLYDASQNLSAMMQSPMTFQPAEKLLEDGQKIPLSDGYMIEVIHTPGHTAGGVCFLLLEQNQPVAIFTGDTLFAGSIGRLDLGGDPLAMEQSLLRLRQKYLSMGLISLPLYPGHGPSTTLGQEISTNPYYQACLNGSLSSLI